MVTKETIWKYLEAVPDPEVPVLSIVDLGIVRSVDIDKDVITITITPTYSGCPAMKHIEQAILEEMQQNNLRNIAIETVLSPAWTTDWMSESGKKKLEAYGIAPPVDEPDKSVLFGPKPIVPCPKCKSKSTRLVSQFGSTSCKALYQCESRQEPFEYFKCLK